MDDVNCLGMAVDRSSIGKYYEIDMTMLTPLSMIVSNILFILILATAQVRCTVHIDGDGWQK